VPSDAPSAQPSYEPTQCIGTAIDIGADQASASSEEGPNFSPDKAVDGNPETRWSSTHDDIEWLDGEWIALDLGAPTLISSVKLHWERSYASSYDLQVADSLSGPWRTIVGITDSDGGLDVHVGLDEVARYVRLLCLVRVPTRNRFLTLYGCSVWEFEVFGCPV
jgi:mannan endo-1,4-beta-mannosidase